MTRHTKGSSAGSTRSRGNRSGSFVRGAGATRGLSRSIDGRGAHSIGLDRSAPLTRPGLAGLVALAALVLLLALGAGGAPAATCPNAVFRTGPSAKLPDCRAYELVTPVNMGGIRPQALNFTNVKYGFEYPLITEAGDSVVFNTVGGALSGTPGNGFNDRYRSRRTSEGWVTELFGPTAEETSRATPGGVSADHQYQFVNAGLIDFTLEPESTLQAPFGGKEADYLRNASGEFELVGEGSLGFSRLARGRLITPGASHIVFTTEERIEPNSPPAGVEAIYDRTPGGPTHLVSVLPDGSVPQGKVVFRGVSPDGTEVIFTVSENDEKHWYVRLNNTTTVEFTRDNAARVGDKIPCNGSPGSATLEYQWLKNGNPIEGATNATYTVTAADEGKTLQCQVLASLAGGNSSIRASEKPRLVPPFEGKNPPIPAGFVPIMIGGSYSQGSGEVGQELTCDHSTWTTPATLPLTYSYQWLRNAVPIGGATSSTYTAVGADAGKALQCRVVGTSADGVAAAFSQIALIRSAIPVATADPSISNVSDPGSAPSVGDELSCAEGAWKNSPSFGYQWLRNGAATGATASSYTVTAADEESVLQCLVTGTNSGGKAVAVSNRLVVDPQPGLAPPEATYVGNVYGDGTVGSNLFCEEDLWTGEPTAIAYQWLRGGTEIAGATEQSYAVTAADLEKTIECRVTATNAGGSTVEINGSGVKYGLPATPEAGATVPTPRAVYGGALGGHVFYGNRGLEVGDEEGLQLPADLFSFDTGDGSTTRITDVGDARFSNVSSDGSRAYFVSESAIDGEGEAGEPNLYVWSRGDGSTKFIATVLPEDITNTYEGANLGSWTSGEGANKSYTGNAGLYQSNTRSTANGSVFLFETTAQLTPFDNTEANPKDCGSIFVPEQRCLEVYRYDTATEELSCLSCPDGPGPATGEATLNAGPLSGTPAVLNINVMDNLTEDGSMAFFESSEDLLPQDGNGQIDIYRWKKGAALGMISSGQALVGSRLYGITPDGSDVVFLSQEQLLPQDENGGSDRIYDARIDGGFPPPESTVTEPCTGDACQGSASGAPEPPQVSSSSLNGGGNVPPPLKCGKGKRRVARNGKELCAKRHRRHRRGSGKHHHRTAHADRGAQR